MATVLKIDGDNISVGMDNGSVETIDRLSFNFVPEVGDDVQVYKDGEKYMVIKKKVEEKKGIEGGITINNVSSNVNTNNNTGYGNRKPKSKIVALILAILLGGLGIHRFYVGKVGTGILWMLTGGLFGIGWLVDIILIAVGSFRDKWGYQLE